MFAKSQYKIGVFDIDIMVQVLPEYSTSVDSVIETYTRDSIVQEYHFYEQEYLKADSSYRSDSALNKPKAILDFKTARRQDLAERMLDFNKVAEYKINQKRSLLARPLYEKVFAAYRKVQLTHNYDLILKPGSYELLSKVDNVFIDVAKELHVKLPKQLEELTNYP
jgi:hypothetical protein